MNPTVKPNITCIKREHRPLEANHCNSEHRIMNATVLFILVLSVMTVGSQSPSSVTEEPDVNTIPGEAGVDYPNYHDIPRTNFKCSGKIVGYYADVEARCQVWHYCSHEGLVESWLCPNGTVYSQEQRVCQWYYDVDCKLSPQFHDVNKDLYIIPERFTSTTTERQRN